MNILLVDVDSTIPNLALYKIKMFHERQGDNVATPFFKDENHVPQLEVEINDMVYVSCVFDWNRHRCEKWEKVGKVMIGGSGYSLTKNLPPEIEGLKPKINWGFTTRGCIRNCPWCVVPQKEGKVREVGDVYDIWDGEADSVTIMDNNILALPDTFFKVCKQIKKENLRVDFNQGLDHRLLTDDICKELFSLKQPRGIGGKLRFAFDHISYKKSVLKALKTLKKNGLKDWQTRWYVYVSIEDTEKTVLERINLLRDWKQTVFLMRDRDERVMRNKEYARMYVWTNHIDLFSYIKFDDFWPDEYMTRKNDHGLFV